MVSATTRHRSAGPGLGHTQKMVRCDVTNVVDTMLVTLKLYRLIWLCIRIVTVRLSRHAVTYTVYLTFNVAYFRDSQLTLTH